MAFLHRWPTLPGKVLVAPREHVEDVVSGFSDDGYMRMMQAVRRVALRSRRCSRRSGCICCPWGPGREIRMCTGTSLPCRLGPRAQLRARRLRNTSTHLIRHRLPGGAIERAASRRRRGYLLCRAVLLARWPPVAGHQTGPASTLPFVSPANRLRGVGEFSASEQ
ncbi:hypothetical protein [Streptomyces microflavus]|uniref:hypothetical protein n=1 Tax=Streptomyces microflavus TaxID=1919 RepID=UPI00382B1426